MKLSIFAQILVGTGAISAAVLPRDTSPNLARRQLATFNTPFTALTQEQFLTQNPDPGATPDGGDSPNPTPTGAVCPNPRVRVEWRNMAESDKLSLVQAIQCLMAAPPKLFTTQAMTRYEELVYVHQQMTTTIHMDGIFLPWHRYFTWIFENMLRDECRYTGPMPWWNEVRDSANFAAAGQFTSQYYGSLPPIKSDGTGSCITDGAFANTMLNIGPGPSSTRHCLSRAWNQTVSRHIHQSFVDLCLSRTHFIKFAVCNENGPHALGHNGIGSVMGDVYASPGDPMFFQHHGFVDQLWNAWQRQNPAFISQVGGFTTQRCRKGTAGCAPMTADTVLTSMGLRASVTVRDMMDITRAPLCYTYDS